MAAVGRSVAVVAATAVPATDAPNGSFSSAPLALSSSAVAAPAQLAPLRSDPGTKLVPAGSGSAMAIPVAVPLPLLVTRMQYRILAPGRSEERRVGKECVSTCRSRW